MTEAELRARLALYIAAEMAILGGSQEYTIGQGSTARKVRRADLEQIRAEIAAINAQLLVIAPAVRRRPTFYLRPGN
jgi:hypothetical protein